jgi:hypothetical protein
VATAPWFIGERSEALAAVFLTRRKDVKIRTDMKSDEGSDLLVEIARDDTISGRFFVVQVKGTVTSDPNEWTQGTGRLAALAKRHFVVPTCLFLINVRDNKAVYAWVAEPCIQENKAALEFHEPGKFAPLTDEAVDHIIQSVDDWYNAIPERCTPQ